jgi:hypothetical protein
MILLRWELTHPKSVFSIGSVMTCKKIIFLSMERERERERERDLIICQAFKMLWMDQYLRTPKCWSWHPFIKNPTSLLKFVPPSLQSCHYVTHFPILGKPSNSLHIVQGWCLSLWGKWGGGGKVWERTPFIPYPHNCKQEFTLLPSPPSGLAL